MRKHTEAVKKDGIATRAVAGALVLLALAATALVGQESETLTLEEALRIARDNNPNFQAARNDRAAADWGVREAYSNLFLPTANANTSFSYVEGGAQRFGTVDLGTSGTDWYQSFYGLNVNWQLSGNSIFGLPAARANQRATDARIDAAQFNLESTVALAYMAVLRAQDGVDVAQRQLDRALQNRRIVSSRVSSGAAAGTDGKQAEVDEGRAEVGLIQAQRTYRETLALLAEQLGTPLDSDVRLSSEFSVFEPTWERDQLMEMALSSHPSLRAFSAQEKAASATARQAASQYFPTVQLSTSFRGTTQEATNSDYVLTELEDFYESRMSNCQFTNALIQGVPTLGGEVQDCSQWTLTDQIRSEELAANNVFPFNYTALPFQATLQVSIPVFTGFTRQRQVSQAYNQAEDAEYNLRAEELRLRTAVTQAFDNLTAAHQVVQLEERNRSLAQEQLQMQQRRYALGAAGMLELLDAQTTLSTAEQAYLNAVYDFHWNLIRLEAAVGQGLRAERQP